MNSPESSRDGNGRFGPGNPGGPGRAKGRGYDLLRAAQDAVTPEAMAAMMRRALRMALEGNLGAMRFVAERTLGRAPEAPVEGAPLGLALPSMRTAADCNLAIDRLGTAVVQGTCDLTAAKVLIDIIQARLKALEVLDLEVRLAEIEKTAAMLDQSGGRR